MSLWAEIITAGKIQASLFGGYSKNLGTDEINIGPDYSRGAYINYIYRIASRVIVKIEKLHSALEMEYTSVQYRKADLKGLVNSNLTNASNLRL